MEQFATYIGGDSIDQENPRLLHCLEVAHSKVLFYVKSTCTDKEDLATSTIPEAIVDLAVIKVADELWNQRNVRPTAKEQFDYGSGLMSNTSRDAMLPAYSLLGGYVLPW